MGKKKKKGEVKSKDDDVDDVQHELDIKHALEQQPLERDHGSKGVFCTTLVFVTSRISRERRKGATAVATAATPMLPSTRLC